MSKEYGYPNLSPLDFLGVNPYHKSINTREHMTKYVIGDLCNCLNQDDWFAYCDNEELPDGAFSFHTFTGDGVYLDQEDREYGVDSGTIGIIPLDKVSDQDKLRTALKYRLVQILDLDEVTEDDCYEEDGVITLGPIVIVTA